MTTKDTADGKLVAEEVDQSKHSKSVKNFLTPRRALDTFETTAKNNSSAALLSAHDDCAIRARYFSDNNCKEIEEIEQDPGEYMFVEARPIAAQDEPGKGNLKKGRAFNNKTIKKLKLVKNPNPADQLGFANEKGQGVGGYLNKFNRSTNPNNLQQFQPSLKPGLAMKESYSFNNEQRQKMSGKSTVGAMKNNKSTAMYHPMIDSTMIS